MATIRPFKNSDLPGLFSVWMGHWEAAREIPPVSVSILERAVLSRSFFRPESLLVAEDAGRVVAWCQHFHDDMISDESSQASVGTGEPNASSEKASPDAIIAALCFDADRGVEACDQLLAQTEQQLRGEGAQQIRVGLVRDDQCGYAGLAPVGHGIGVPVADARTASLLARHGYGVLQGIERLVATTSTYRAPVNREALQLRRSTRVDRFAVLPFEQRVASAMCHFDLERHVLIDHREHRALAEFGLWLGDPEMQVMEGSRAILSFRLFPNEAVEGLPTQNGTKSASESTDGREEATDMAGESVVELSPAEQFLISSMVQTLSSRQVLTIETAVDSSQEVLLNQLLALRFQKVEQGKQWAKQIAETS